MQMGCERHQKHKQHHKPQSEKETMKVAMLQFLLPLCFILFVLNTQPLVVAAASEPVFDIHGQPLQPGVGYHVRPLSADGGGLELGPTLNHTCPLDVILDPNSNGVPAYFSAPGLDYIPTLTDLTIDMIVLGPCLEDSRVWKLRVIDPGSYFFFVSTNGVPGETGSKFKIERLQGEPSYEIYSFKYCPSNESYVPICKPVGTYVDADGTKVMAIGNRITEPYYVRFQKASTYPQEKKNRDFSIV